MIKYIATDLDGTLFYPRDRKNMIRKENLFFVQSFIDNGGKLIIVTGRSIEFGKKVVELIGRDCPIVCYNGGVIFDKGKVIKSQSISKDNALEIIDEMNKSYKLPAVFVMTENGMRVHLRTKLRFVRFLYYFFNKCLGKYAEQVSGSEEDYQNSFDNETIFKILLFVGITRKKQFQAKEMNKIIRSAYPNLESSWSNQAIEVSPNNCSKGAGIRQYCQINNIKDDEILVVGDSGNDISMFKEFPENSFCMSRSSNIIKKYARYTINKIEDLSRYLTKK